MRQEDEFVQFTIPERHMKSHAFRQALETASGVPASEFERSIDQRGEVKVICRLDQFARFMVDRNELGGDNSFRDLNPRIFSRRAPEVIDVSGNVSCCKDGED